MESEQTIQENNLLNSELPKKFLVTPEMVLEWKNYYLKEGHSFHSTTTYYNYIKRFVDYGIEVNQKTLDRFRNKSSSGACAGALKNFFKFLVDKKDFPQEIKGLRFDKSRSVKKFPKSIDPLEVQKIIDAMPSIMEKNLTKTLYELGLRISEGLKLTWQDFSWSNWLQDRTKQGSVNLKNTKGEKFRTIPVPRELMETLYNDHIDRTSDGIPKGGLVFDYGIKNYQDSKIKEENQYNYIVGHAEDSYRKLLYRISQEVLGRRINPHQLRHTKAQELLNKGLPLDSLKSFLGHSRISSTEIYAQASAEKLKKDMEKINGI